MKPDTQFSSNVGGELPCGHGRCTTAALAEWRGLGLCVTHFLEPAREYVDFCCSWEAYQGANGRVADRELLTSVIFQIARIFAGPAQLDRSEQMELQRLLSFCHGLLRMATNHATKFTGAAGKLAQLGSLPAKFPGQ